MPASLATRILRVLLQSVLPTPVKTMGPALSLRTTLLPAPAVLATRVPIVLLLQVYRAVLHLLQLHFQPL